MFRNNDLPHEPIPSHQAGLPLGGAHQDTGGGSGELGLMVGGYLLALFAGILLLGTLTPTAPVMSVVATDTVPTN